MNEQKENAVFNNGKVTVEEQINRDRLELQPIVEEVFEIVRKHNLCYRQYKHLVDSLIHSGADNFILPPLKRD